MKRTYFSPSEVRPKPMKVVIQLAAALTLTLTLMTNTGQAETCDRYAVDAENKIEDARVAPMPDRNSSDVTFEFPKLTISLHDNEATCADMMTAAVQRLKLSAEAQDENKDLIDKMTDCLHSIPATKVTADYDSYGHSLEFVFLLEGGLIASVSKAANTMDNNYALLTFIYKRNVVWADEVSLSEVAEHIQSIDSKLQQLN